MTVVAGWPEVFRGTAAVAAGLVTPGRLRGPEFDRLLPDTYAHTPTSPAGARPDLRLRSLAASHWAGPGAVLCGYSAAELLGASCGPWNAPAEVNVTGAGPRSRPGVRVRRDALHPGEVTEVGGVRVTTRLRTAFDLARWLPPTEAVVAVDALARGEFAPDLLLNFAARYSGLRGVRRVADVLAHADPRSGSPPETRLRLILVRGGLPRPVPQHPVLDDGRRRAFWLDLAYPEHRWASSTTAASTSPHHSGRGRTRSDTRVSSRPAGGCCATPPTRCGTNRTGSSTTSVAPSPSPAQMQPIATCRSPASAEVHLGGETGRRGGGVERVVSHHRTGKHDRAPER